MVIDIVVADVVNSNPSVIAIAGTSVLVVVDAALVVVVVIVVVVVAAVAAVAD